MAIRFDALTDAAQVSVAGLSGGAFTLTGWVVLATDLNTYTGIASLESAGGPAVALSTKVDGTTFTAWDNAGTETGALGTISATVGVVTPVWYRFAVVQNAGTQSLYIGTTVGALTKGSKVQTNNTTPDKIVLGSTLFADYFNGRLASVKFHVGALSDDEVALELSQYRPVRSDGLIAWYPLISDLKDYSGNGRDLTAGSTATAIEDGPALRWDSRLQPRIMRSTATGGPGAVTGAAAAPLGGLTANASGTAWRNVSTLTDSFDDNSINSTKWPFTFGPGTVAETGGKMTVGAVVAGDLTGIFSDNHYSFAGNTVSIQMVPPALNGAAWAYCALTLYHAGYASWARLYIERDAGTPETFKIGFTLKESGVTTRSTFVAGSLADAAWVRLREAGGTTYAEMSATGAPGSWVTADSFTTPPSLLASRQVEVDLEAQRTTGASSAAGPATFDNLNLPGHTGDILDIGATDLNHFSLQYAVNGAGSPSTATQADIAAGFAVDPYFYPTTDGQRVQLWARLDGPTTAGASFSRAELREVKSDGSDAAWDATAGSHELRVKVTPTHLPAVTPAVVFAQMYDNVATADRISIRTQLVSSTARLRIRINGSTVALDATSPINPGSNDLAVGVGNIVGVEWDFKIALSGGAIAIYVNNMTTPVLTRPAGTLANNGAANYWKTGCYNQASTATGDSGTDWGSVELRGLAVSHAVPGTASAALGGLAATAAGTRRLPASAAATLGGLTASATATRRTSAAAAAPFGRLTAAATGTVRHPATATAPLGRLVSSASATVRRTAAAASSLGALTATGSATTRHPAVASASFGGLTATAAATRRAAATAVAPLGSLTPTAQAAVRVPAAAAAPLGALTAGATAQLGHGGSATAALGGLTGSANGTPTTPTPPAPTAAYSFDETGPTVVDATGNGHSFPLGSNLTRTVDGHTDGGLTTRVDGAITQMANPAFGQTADRTVMMWVKGSGVVWYIRWQVASIDSGAWGILRLGGQIGVQLRDASGFQRFLTAAPTDGEWHHYAASYNQTTGDAAFYLDGVVAASGTFTGPIRADASTIDLAEFDPATTIDDLRIYDVALTAGQVAAAADTPVGAPALGAASASFGRLTAAATATVARPASGAAPMGALTAAASSSVTVPAAASAPLGGLAASAVARRNATATAAGQLGRLVATVSGAVRHPATAGAALGRIVATAAAAVAHASTAAAPLGGLTGVAGGHISRGGVAAATLGGLSAAAVVRVAVPGAAHATLRALAASAKGRIGVAAAAAAVLGGLTSAADGTSTGDGSGVASAELGALTATAAGRRNAAGVATSNLGGLTAEADAVRRVSGAAVVDLGALQALASAEAAVVAVAVAALGGLDADAVASLERVGAAVADLRGLTASADAVPTAEGAAAATFGLLLATAVGVVAPPTTWTPPLRAGAPVKTVRSMHAGQPTSSGGRLHAGQPTRD
jgi:hypothetical protein